LDHVVIDLPPAKYPETYVAAKGFLGTGMDI
jgi:hypothetical protein